MSPTPISRKAAESWYAREGTPSPSGVTWMEGEAAYNFALYSEFATQVTLLLSSELDLSIPTYEHVFDPLGNKTIPLSGARA